MAIWLSPAPAGQTTNQLYSIRSWGVDRSDGWFNPNGDEVRWWEGPNAGIQFRPSPCAGASCDPFIETCETCEGLGCNNCDLDLDYPSYPNYADLKPFWVKAGFEACPPGMVDPDAVYADLLNVLNATQYTQIARRFHLILQSIATDLTGATPSTVTEGIGTLLRARGTLGLNWGGLVVPGYALPALTAAGLITVTNNQVLGPAGIPVWVDPGLPITGPGGTAPPAGAAYIYLVSQPPTFAIRQETLPGGDAWSWSNLDTRSMFYRADCDGCGDCFEPFARRRAVVATDTCAIYAIAVDVQDCCCGQG